MKKLILIMMILAFVGANVVIAADAPGVVVYENAKGNVSFDHKAHAEKLGDCAKCHEGEPAKIEVNKDFGHSTCKDCHTEMNGPTKCNDCHKK